MISSYSRKASLDNAYARVRRATEHLTQLEREFTAYWRSASNQAIIFRPGQTGMKLATLSEPLASFSSILVGETIYNLRAALDYLVYELANLDSGQIQKNTQFPIVDYMKSWQEESHSKLKGLSSSHKAAIERLQPFRNCDWTRILREISNPDKHRSFIVVRMSAVLHSNISRTNQTILPPTLQMLFEEDGRPVMKTLQELQGQVAGVLDIFKPDFP